MKITFIIPSWHYFFNPFKLQPYWEMYYATILESQFPGAEITIYDLRNTNKKNFDEEVQKIPEADFYLYWIMKSGDAIELYSVSKSLKVKFPKSKHIAGGTHIDMLPNESELVFDKIVIGPGEKSFMNAINEKNLDNKRYLSDYKDYPFKDTPFPKRDFLPEKSVINNQMFEKYGSPKATMVYFSRGCFYRCSYCVYNVPNSLQVKSKERMLEEINYLKEIYGVEAILLKDEIAINPKKELFQNQMDAIGQSNIIWRGQTTSIATLDQLKLAKDTGCVELSVGVETIDEGVMKIINKQWQNQNTIRTFVENARKAGIKIKVCLIFGLPGEPRDIVEKTIKFLDSIHPDYVSLSGFCPLPGSPIYKNPELYSIKKIDNDWSKHAHLLYRFSDEEEVGIPFEYKENASWGKAFSRKEIRENIIRTQRWLEDKKMTY
jgi:anaerobic magnesium-protoporphyrin IX monomethyl ester cyclase